MMLGKANKKGTARMKKLEATFSEDHRHDKFAFLEEPDQTKVASRSTFSEHRLAR
ncbi:hypothetical protein M1N56_06280 [Dehalococcoidia bacterium]|nr:hypothetical protein [Dehalococcoidia bacterium]